MRALLTRPRADSEALAALLAKDGIETEIAPLLEIVLEPAPVDLSDVQALLFTSANGVRAFAAATGDRSLPAYCVGDATAREAAAEGFAAAESAGGDVTDLEALVRARLNPADGALLHVSGHRVAGDLAGALAAAGFTVRRAVLYRAEIPETLPEAARRALAAEEIDAAPFFSPRTARTFVTLIREAGMGAVCARIAAYCLSPAVADGLCGTGVTWGAVRVAEAPTQDALVALMRHDCRRNVESDD